MEGADAAQYRSAALRRRADLPGRVIYRQLILPAGSGFGRRADQFQPYATVPGASATFGASATYLDRPTISYTPIAGDRFTKSLLTPIPPAAVFELIQAGYPADFVLQVTTRALNGVFNRSSVGGRARGADPKFYPILDALRRLQLSGAVGLRLDRRGQDETLRLILLDSGPPRSTPTSDWCARPWAWHPTRAMRSRSRSALCRGPSTSWLCSRDR